MKRRFSVCSHLKDAFLVISSETLLCICLLSWKWWVQYCMYHTLHKQNKSTSKKIQAWRIKMFAVTLQELRVQNLLGRLSFTVGSPHNGYCRKDSRHHKITWQLSLKKLGGIRFTKIQVVGQYLHQTSRATAYHKGNWTQVPHLSGRALSLLFRQSLSLHTTLLFIKNKQTQNARTKLWKEVWAANLESQNSKLW